MTTAILKTEQTVRAWGNSLAIRITGSVARALQLADGVPVTLELHGKELIVRAANREQKLTLAQKLELFDPKLHGGEAMASGRVGAEVF